MNSSDGVVPRSVAISPSATHQAGVRAEGDFADHKSRRIDRAVRRGRDLVKATDERFSSGRVAECAKPFGSRRQRNDRPPAGDAEEHDRTLVERPRDVDRPGLHLRPDPGTGGPLLLHRVEDHPDGIRRGIGLEQGRQRGRNAELARQVAEHLDARSRQPGIEELVHDLQHSAVFTEHSAQGTQLVVMGEAGWHRTERVVDVDIARRQSDRAGQETRAQQVTDGRNLVGSRGAAGVVTHHVHS